MKLFTRDTDYAVRAISCIAKSRGDLVTVTELSKCLKMPRPFLRKILQALSHNGLLKSSKGINGGFSLALTPEKITVYDVMKAFQGDLQLTEHVFRGRPCPEIKTCCLKKKICDIEERLTRDLRSITITSLI